jgi:DNA-binding MarR family transcriptional regulator
MPSDPSTVRAMLVLLEKRGLVCRDSHPTDARAKTVALTRAGQKMFHKLWLEGQSIRNRMVNSLSVQEAETLVNLLRRVSDSLSESPPAQVATSPTRER